MEKGLSDEALAKITEVLEEIGWSILAPSGDDEPVDHLIIGPEAVLKDILSHIDGDYDLWTKPPKNVLMLF